MTSLEELKVECTYLKERVIVLLWGWIIEHPQDPVSVIRKLNKYLEDSLQGSIASKAGNKGEV